MRKVGAKMGGLHREIKTPLSARWAQMTKQEQVIEKKKLEIQAKLDAQRRAALNAKLKAKSEDNATPSSQAPNPVNAFSNDGSFLDQFKKLVDNKATEIKTEPEPEAPLPKEEPESKSTDEDQTVCKEPQEAAEATVDALENEVKVENTNDGHQRGRYDRSFDRNRSRSSSRERGNNRRDRRGNRDDRRDHRDRGRWTNDRGRRLMSNSPMTPVIDDIQRRNSRFSNSPIDKINSIPSLMQFPINPNVMNQSRNMMFDGPNMPPFMNHQNTMGPQMGNGNFMRGPPPHMPSCNIPPFMNGPPNMGGPPNMNGPPNMGGQPNMNASRNMNGPTNINGPPNMSGPSSMNCPPNMCGPLGPQNMNCPPNISGSPNMNGPSNINCPPNMGPPPNFMMGMGPSGPNFEPMRGPIPFGLPGRNQQSDNCGQQNRNTNSMGGFSQNNMPFMHNTGQKLPLHTIPEPKPLDAIMIPPPEPMKLQNIPPPMPICIKQIPKPKELDLGNIPPPPPPPNEDASIAQLMETVAKRVAQDGDQWEDTLKSSQHGALWFLHELDSVEYRLYRTLVNKYRMELSWNNQNRSQEDVSWNNQNQSQGSSSVPPEDKYEPEFSLQDEDSEGDGGHTSSQGGGSYYNGNKSQQHNEYGMESERKFKNDSNSEDDNESRQERRRKRKSRWGDDGQQNDASFGGSSSSMAEAQGQYYDNAPAEIPKLVALPRQNPALMQYAVMNYGSTNLSPEEWKKCEDNFKLNLLYQDMMRKRQELEKLAAAGKHRYEYDSDEDTEFGTWEHKLRSREMNATDRWATELTKQAAGKHHIGDFLPPEELKKFMEKYSAVKSGKEPDLSDYKEFKLKEDNIGFKMLQKLGWNEGQGLGAEGTGIVAPVNKASQRDTAQGLGVANVDDLSAADDEFDAYRKRMMLAYRFRPNPLNNPRRPYY